MLDRLIDSRDPPRRYPRQKDPPWGPGLLEKFFLELSASFDLAIFKILRKSFLDVWKIPLGFLKNRWCNFPNPSNLVHQDRWKIADAIFSISWSSIIEISHISRTLFFEISSISWSSIFKIGPGLKRNRTRFLKNSFWIFQIFWIRLLLILQDAGTSLLMGI